MNQKNSIEEEYVLQNFNSFNITGQLKGSSAANLFIIEKDNTEYILKIACTKGIDNGNEKLRDEIIFLERVGVTYSGKFVTVLDKNITGNNVWYIMPYYKDYQTIYELIKNNQDCNSVFDTLFNFLFDKLYTNHISTFDNKRFIDDNLGRVTKRLTEACELDSSFTDIVNSNSIILNNSTYLNYSKVFEQLLNDFPEQLSNTTLSLIHKDLSIENILVKKELTYNDLIIIDPRGPGNVENYTDYIYDLAKFSYTLNGFSSIKYSQYNFKENKALDYAFMINTEEDKLYSSHRRYLNSLLDHLVSKVFPEDYFWKDRLLFTEACHFLSNVPCFIHNGEKEKAICLYLQGIKLLNDYLHLANNQRVNGILQY